MKLEKLLTKAKKELKGIKEEKALKLVKVSLLRVKSCEKTLKQLKKAHEKLLKADIADIEVEDFEF